MIQLVPVPRTTYICVQTHTCNEKGQQKGMCILHLLKAEGGSRLDKAISLLRMMLYINCIKKIVLKIFKKNDL